MAESVQPSAIDQLAIPHEAEQSNCSLLPSQPSRSFHNAPAPGAPRDEQGRAPRRGTRGPCIRIRAEGARPKGRTPSECLSRDGGDPLSHGLLRSTMGARGLSFRVRDGSGRSPPAMAAGPRGAFSPGAPSRALGAAQHGSDDSLPHAAGPRPGLPPRGGLMKREVKSSAD